MKCPKCRKNEAQIHTDYGVIPCIDCQDIATTHLGERPEFYSASKSDRIALDRDRTSRDTIQPYGKGGSPNPDFIKAFPAHAKIYFTKDQLKNI